MLISEGRAMLGVIALHCGGGDVGKTKWLMYTRCQCSIIYIQAAKWTWQQGPTLSTLTTGIQLRAMTAKTNAMARKAERHHTEPPLNDAI
jgi:hypothetical protein